MRGTYLNQRYKKWAFRASTAGTTTSTQAQRPLPSHSLRHGRFRQATSLLRQPLHRFQCPRLPVHPRTPLTTQESGCFLKNKVKPLTEEQIIERVIEYLLELVRVANPKKLLYIALDGVAPRAKINQSRDRRFKSGVEDIEFFDDLAEKIGISTQ